MCLIYYRGLIFIKSFIVEMMEIMRSFGELHCLSNWNIKLLFWINPVEIFDESVFVEINLCVIGQIFPNLT